MGKKSRRKAKYRAGGKFAHRVPVERVYPPKPTLESKAVVPSVEPSVPSVQAKRYQYILPELRHIGIISGALFLILIILTFILR
ncbi:MAG: hypothetical protein FJ023_01100 [Chloroflexi bacterium]|nr:hypothetical protein [Chloroflexota bacterium]